MARCGRGVKVPVRQAEVERYLKRLRVEVVDELNGWVRCRCPFAQWKHDSRYDNEQRFGVTHDEDDASYFNCFVCGEKGPFSALPGRLGKRRDDPSLAGIGKQIELDEILGTETVFGDWDETPIKRNEKKTRITDFPPRSDFLKYPPASGSPDALRYLASRGIYLDTVVSIGLRYDTRRERILFPVLDFWTGKYIGCSGRLIWSEHKRVCEEKRRTEFIQKVTGDPTKKVKIPKVRDYSGLEKRNAFLGTYGRRSRTGNRVAAITSGDFVGNHYWIVVEGLMAYARFVQLGFRDNVIAILGSALTPGKQEILRASDRAVYWFVDPDAGGSKCLHGVYDPETETYDDTGALEAMYGDVIQYVPTWPEDLDDPDKIPDRQTVLDMMAAAEPYIKSRA